MTTTTNLGPGDAVVSVGTWCKVGVPSGKVGVPSGKVKTTIFKTNLKIYNLDYSGATLKYPGLFYIVNPYDYITKNKTSQRASEKSPARNLFRTYIYYTRPRAGGPPGNKNKYFPSMYLRLTLCYN